MVCWKRKRRVGQDGRSFDLVASQCGKLQRVQGTSAFPVVVPSQPNLAHAWPESFIKSRTQKLFRPRILSILTYKSLHVTLKLSTSTIFQEQQLIDALSRMRKAISHVLGDPPQSVRRNVGGLRLPLVKHREA